jgi:hypothetical protein
MSGDTQAFALALKNGIDCSDAQGNTALIAAAFAGNNALVLQLLEAKADVSKQNDTGCDAAWVAAAYGKTDVLVTLLAAGGSAISCNKQAMPLPSLLHTFSIVTITATTIIIVAIIIPIIIITTTTITTTRRNPPQIIQLHPPSLSLVHRATAPSWLQCSRATKLQWLCSCNPAHQPLKRTKMETRPSGFARAKSRSFYSPALHHAT